MPSEPCPSAWRRGLSRPRKSAKQPTGARISARCRAISRLLASGWKPCSATVARSSSPERRKRSKTDQSKHGRHGQLLEGARSDQRLPVRMTRRRAGAALGEGLHGRLEVVGRPEEDGERQGLRTGRVPVGVSARASPPPSRERRGNRPDPPLSSCLPRRYAASAAQREPGGNPRTARRTGQRDGGSLAVAEISVVQSRTGAQAVGEREGAEPRPAVRDPGCPAQAPLPAPRRERARRQAGVKRARPCGGDACPGHGAGQGIVVLAKVESPSGEESSDSIGSPRAGIWWGRSRPSRAPASAGRTVRGASVRRAQPDGHVFHRAGGGAGK